MIQRVIPSSGETIPIIGLGTYQTFNLANAAAYSGPLDDIVTLLSTNRNCVIDSSPMYGKSEATVGVILERNKLQHPFFLATKVWTNGRAQGIKEMNRSFERMKTSVMDLMQIHNLVDWKTHLPVLREWKIAGKIRYTGITHYHEGAFNLVEQVLRSEQVDFLQINYSIRGRSAEESLFPLSKEKGTAVIVNMPFDSGSLFSYVKNKPLPDFAKEIECTSWAAYFIKFIISHPAVTCVIPATSNLLHLKEYLKAGTGIMPEEKMRKKMLDYFLSL